MKHLVSLFLFISVVGQINAEQHAKHTIDLDSFYYAELLNSKEFSFETEPVIAIVSRVLHGIINGQRSEMVALLKDVPPVADSGFVRVGFGDFLKKSIEEIEEKIPGERAEPDAGDEVSQDSNDEEQMKTVLKLIDERNYKGAELELSKISKKLYDKFYTTKEGRLIRVHNAIYNTIGFMKKFDLLMEPLRAYAINDDVYIRHNSYWYAGNDSEKAKAYKTMNRYWGELGYSYEGVYVHPDAEFVDTYFSEAKALWKEKFDATLLDQNTRYKKALEDYEKQYASWEKQAKEMGYDGVVKGSVISVMIAITKKGIDPSKFFNKVIVPWEPEDYEFWSKEDKNPDFGLKVNQILSDACMYHYFNIRGSSSTSFSVHVKKWKGMLYVRDQPLPKGFYGFKDIFSYNTVLGAANEIPSFERVFFK